MNNEEETNENEVKDGGQEKRREGLLFFCKPCNTSGGAVSSFWFSLLHFCAASSRNLFLLGSEAIELLTKHKEL